MARPVCAIVGAGEGLGRALAARFAKGGCDIALLSRSETGSAAARDAAADAGAKVRFFPADATRPESIEQAFSDIEREVGSPEIMIYNARGDYRPMDPVQMTYGALEENFRIEVVGAFAAAKSVLAAMRTRRSGTIMFSSATEAYRGSPTYPLYSIGKFGLRALSQSLAKAYAKDGVHVVHVRLDCTLDTAFVHGLYEEKLDTARLANVNDVAESYWWTHKQPKSAWSNEIELRPYTELWAY